MSHLNTQGKQLLGLLVKKLPKIRPGDPKTYVTYKDIHQELGLTLKGDTYGSSLQNQGLNNLAHWAKAKNKPAITGIIVSQDSRTPGSGFFELFGKKEEDFNWWEKQVKSAKAYDWSPYLS
jgi:hypothetical protein